jgi:hypothetical protein
MSEEMRFPSIMASPDEGGISPVSMLMVVDLPAEQRKYIHRKYINHQIIYIKTSQHNQWMHVET